MDSQTKVDQGKRSLSRRSLVIGGLVGAVVTLCCVSIIAFAVIGVILSQRVDQGVGQSATRTPPPPSATLNVAADGCTVIRSEVELPGRVPALQWVIVDESGRQVLARNALGENRYTYFRSGKYDVVLQTFYNGRYIDISQHVKIDCR